MSVVSVIIPVYNVETYLDDCVKSVVGQTYTDLEIVLVNDGSTDRSGEMCDCWAKTDPRIRVIHKENGGAADSRNAGVRYAIGEYIMFMDSDDFWDDEGALARLMNRVEQTHPDVLNFSFKKYYEDSNQKQSYITSPEAMPIALSGKERLEYIAQHNVFLSSPCTKLVKQTLFHKCDLMFRIGVCSEDIEWCAKLMCQAEKMDFVLEDFYCYRQVADSVSHKIDNKKCMDLRDNLVRCFDLLMNADDDVKILFYPYMAFQYATFFAVQAQAENWQKDCLRSLQPYKWILRHHGGNRKVQLLHFCCNLIGYKNTCRLMRCVYRKR